MPLTCPPREASLLLVHEYVSRECLIRQMLPVEAAVRAYARRFGADEQLWGTAALPHDFDFERWPGPPAHPLQGAADPGVAFDEHVMFCAAALDAIAGEPGMVPPAGD